MQAAPTSIAAALSAPRAWATSGAALGQISSGGHGRDEDEVELLRGDAGIAQRLPRGRGGEVRAGGRRRRRGGACGCRCASRSSRRRRRGARRSARSAGPPAGSWWPSPSRRDAGLGGRAVAGERRERRRDRRSAASGMGGLDASRSRGGVRDDPPRELGEHLARAGVDEALGAVGVQREHRLAPAHGRGQRGGELRAHVGRTAPRSRTRRRGSGARRRSRPRAPRRTARPPAPSPASGTRRRRRAAIARTPRSRATRPAASSVVARAGEHDLPRRVVVGDGEAGGARRAPRRPRRSRRAARASIPRLVGLGHQPAAQRRRARARPWASSAPAATSAASSPSECPATARRARVAS